MAVFAAHDRVAVRLTFRGTHTGEFQGSRPAAKSADLGRQLIEIAADALAVPAEAS